MADHTLFATRRRNVTPTSSTIRADMTRDVDCSSADFLQPPEDGQFVSCHGLVANNPHTLTFTGINPAAVDAAKTFGPTLKMVWASALQPDRQALGDKRVPVLWSGGIEVECKLFDCDTALDLDDAANFAPGNMVTVRANTDSVALKSGSVVTDVGERLILAPYDPTLAGWIVGYVTGTSRTGAAPVSGDSITVRLYEEPRFIPISGV